MGVPDLCDEQTTELSRQAYRQIQRDDPDLAETLEKPEPIYRWVYRPEMQFSSYQLEMKEVKLALDTNNDDLIEDSEKVNILDSETPGIPPEGIISLLYDLDTTDLLPLDYFNAGETKELVFAVGEQEIRATLGTDQTLQFEDLSHLAELSPDDFLTIRLYANNDAANVLWEWAFDSNGLIVNTSSDPGSREQKSFIICDTVAQKLGICGEQQAITVQLTVDLSPTDTVVWQVEALPGVGCDENGQHCPGDDLPGEDDDGSGPGNKPDAYGETKDWKIGLYVANNPEAGQSGTGLFKDPWLSRKKPFTEAKSFSFHPDMLKEPHTPATYTKGGDKQLSLNGTKKTDVWRHNPHVAYKIKATVNSLKTYEVIVKMDEVDVLRQEYINHAVSINSNDMGLPERLKIKNLDGLPPGEWGSTASDAPYAYQYVLEDGMVRMWNTISADFVIHRQNQYNNLAVPNNALEVSSSYRNPERNERVGGALRSNHMTGRALDIKFGGTLGQPSLERGILFGSLWEMVEGGTGDSAQASFWQLEKGTTPNLKKGSTLPPDGNNNDVPDVFEDQDHLHIQEDKKGSA